MDVRFLVNKQTFACKAVSKRRHSLVQALIGLLEVVIDLHFSLLQLVDVRTAV